MKKILAPGSMLPPFYGLAYRDYAKDQVIIYPLFINLFIILWRDFVFWMRDPKGRP